ncbi:MAG: 6-phosphogluconolactonase [Actinobacteria bacterium]|nr:6-phosphogluconolactonase [Actinomycetota bacterium]
MIHVVADPEGLAVAGSRLIGTMLGGRARQTGAELSFVLSGGTTPLRLYELLAGESGDKIPWPRINVFWGDERCVPPEDMRSNYRMASRTGLLDRPLAGVHRVPGELIPEEGAYWYTQVLNSVFPGKDLPRFDLILLGLGSDGHVASLFQGSPGLTDREHWVVPTEEYEGTRRLTFTLPVLASARGILFLVNGKAKAEAVRQTLGKERVSGGQILPARLLMDMIAVKQKAGWECPAVSWVIDRAAAALLPSLGHRAKTAARQKG